MIPGRLQCAVSDFRVARLVPRDSSQVVLSLKILEANVPNESSEGFDGINLVPLGANESQAQVLIGILWKPRRAIRRVVIARVFKRLEPHIAQGCRAALK